jgi:DNA polymerase eta
MMRQGNMALIDGEADGPSDRRVVLHIDMDAFYCQVECRRLGLDREMPMCVQQWDGLIAVNYPAKSRGITRHMRARDAVKLVPDVRLVHVETIGDDEQSKLIEDSGGVEDSNQRLSRKACLERYRLANLEILEVLHGEVPSHCVIERASIDEVFIDVTSLVDEEIGRMEEIQDEAQQVFTWNSVTYGGTPLMTSDQTAVRLATGAKIAARLRGAIQCKCQFTSSAGIACNKLLAKVGSALNKPNQQTVIHPSSVALLMKNLPLRKLRNFGGKLGDEIETLVKKGDIDTPLMVSDVFQIPRSLLDSRFGAARADFILQLARGYDNSAVVEKERTKSMLAAKSFAAISDVSAVEKWISILAMELEGRMRTDLKTYKRHPKTLCLTWRSKSSRQEKTRRCPMPKFPGKSPCRRVLTRSAMLLFKTRCMDEAFPCVRLALTAQDFQDCPDERLSIKRFFAGPLAGGSLDEAGGALGDAVEDGSENSHAAEETSVKESPIDEVCKSEDILAGFDVEEQKKLFKEAQMIHRMTTKPHSNERELSKNEQSAKRPKKTIGSFFKSVNK